MNVHQELSSNVRFDGVRCEIGVYMCVYISLMLWGFC